MSTAQVVRWVGLVPGVGRVLRWYAHRFPEGSIVTIRCGHASGMRWKRHHRYVNGYWIGHYELAVQQAIKTLLRPGFTFFDIGANAGFFTLVAARAVGNRGRCLAIDPLLENHQSVSEQIQLNDLRHCQSRCLAVSKEPGMARICFASAGSSTAHLGPSRSGERQIDVIASTLDELASEFGVPHIIKMDIEGAEVEALMGARSLITSGRPTWLIELHGSDCSRQVGRILRKSHYRLYDLRGNHLSCENAYPRHMIAKP